jgi:hypothetical protein
MSKEIRQEKPITQEYVKAKPEILPEPTYMPFLLAFSLLLIAAGFIGLCISLYGWIKELLHERTED